MGVKYRESHARKHNVEKNKLIKASKRRQARGAPNPHRCQFDAETIPFGTLLGHVLPAGQVITVLYIHIYLSLIHI